MPINTKYTLAYPDPNGFFLPRSLYRGARRRAILCPFQLTSADAAGTIVYVGKIRSSAIILPSSNFLFGAVTGCTVKLGTDADDDCLIPAKAIANAGSMLVTSLLPIAGQSKRVWELSGLAIDPGREMDLLLTLTADATPAAPVDCLLQIDFSDEQ